MTLHQSTDPEPPAAPFRARLDLIRSVIGHAEGHEVAAVAKIRALLDDPLRYCAYCRGPIALPVEDESDDPGEWCGDCDEVIWAAADAAGGVR